MESKIEKENCYYCKNTGEMECDYCFGSGRVNCLKCLDCEGSGKFDFCPYCGRKKEE